MKKFAEVEAAKALMMEGLSWSVIKWIAQKKRVRKTADKANNLLWATQKALKDSWSEELISAYDALAARTGTSASDRQRPARETAAVDPVINRLAKAVKQLDDEAYAAHLDAEETFDKADRTLSTAKAREGCRKAILSWELYEKALLKSAACATHAKSLDEPKQATRE